jgi:glycosyltransferase involved in cell wall biosynthesis
MSSGPFLSVVIPAYNEEARIASTLDAVTRHLQGCPFSREVLVVDDGSTDGTARLVQTFIDSHPGVYLVRVPHGGKGWAVKHGMLQARGQYRFLCDADLSMPIEHLSRFLPPQCPASDIVIGSREVPGARRIGEPWRRHLMGRVFNFLVRTLTVPGIQDTQCGFKCFKGQAARELATLQKLKGFSFDAELLFLARKRGLSIAEIPIDWYYRSNSKVRPLRDSLRMVLDLLSIRWNSLRGRYGKASAAIRDDAACGPSPLEPGGGPLAKSSIQDDNRDVSP